MATLTPFGMDSNGQWRIAVPTDVISNPEIATGTVPTVALTAAAGTGATTSIVGDNRAGKISLTTGTLALGIGKVLGLTFSGGLTYPNGCFVTFSAAEANFAGVLTRIYCQGRTNGVDLFVTLALALSTTYTGHYQVTGY